MDDVQVFVFQDIPVRAFEIDGEIYVIANDICAALEYTNPRKAISDHVEEGDVTKRDTIDELGRTQSLNCVNESGLYSLIFGSKKPTAKKFKRWVTSEVLPTLRKVGSYKLERDPEGEATLKIAVDDLVRLIQENAVMRRRILLEDVEKLKADGMKAELLQYKKDIHLLLRNTDLSNEQIADYVRKPQLDLEPNRGWAEPGVVADCRVFLNSQIN